MIKKIKKKSVTKKKVLPEHEKSSVNHKANKKKKIKRKWWKKLLSLFLVLGALGVFAVFAFCIYIVSTCGEFDPNALANQDQTVIYDSQDNIIGKLGMEKRESVSYNDLPQVLIDAIIATEDSRYFEHNGMDGARFLKASIGQVLHRSGAGGASTLTMQVVKNNLTSTEQTITRKFKDIYLAVFFMEKKYTKEEILEFYVNDSLLGGNVYGVEEASKYYFGKSVSDLSLPEAAIIAGLFQSPNGYNPYYYPERTANRRNTVLKLMVRHGYITQEEADIANSVDVSSLLVGNGSEGNSYQGFIDTVVAEVKEKTGFDPALVSMEIHTTMDAGIQDGINKVLAGDGYNWINDKVQAGISIVDVKTGAITAIGTGRNRTGERQWNYATQSYRQPGSTAKPVFAYAPGFEYDNFSTYQLFTDEEWTYTGGGKIGNWDGGYQGLMTLKRAVAVSRNIPALKAFQKVNKDVGNEKIVNFIEGLGIDLTDKSTGKHAAYESYSIGGLGTGVTTLQMAAAYAAFANGGYYTSPYCVKSIKYRSSGEIKEFEVKKQQAMKPSTAYLTTNVLEYAAHNGFSGGTSGYRGAVAVKTGTSNYDDATMKKYGLPGSAVNDLWSVAYTPQYSIALWYGYDEISREFYNSSGTPKDNLMAAIMRHIPVTNEQFSVPDDVVAAEIELESWPAMKPSEYTPAALRGTEYFIKGTEPTEVSPRFAKLNAVTNLKATSSGSGVKLTWDYKEPEVLSNDYLNKYFSQDVFGNSSSKFLQERIAYNNDTLGGLGFGIYIKNGGNLTSVGFTTDKNYTYSGSASGNITFVVKAEYRNFKNNASDGVETRGTSNGGGNNTSEYLTVKLDGNSTMNAAIGSYTERGIIATYNGLDVSSKADITYSLNGTDYATQSALEDAVNAISSPGKITIKYKVKYKDEDADLSRTVNLS